MMKRSTAIAILVFILPFAGCIHMAAYYDLDTNLIEASYEAADELIAQLNPPFLRDQTIVAASFVNVDDLLESSTFGRIMADHMAARLIHRGFTVVEMEPPSPFLPGEQGEMLLSRELLEVGTAHDATVLMAGTYAAADDVVYVSARLINTADRTIIAAHEYKLPLGENNRRMLSTVIRPKEGRFPPGPLD